MSHTIHHKEAQAYHNNLATYTTPAVLGDSHQRQTSALCWSTPLSYVWDPHQQHLTNSIEFVQRRAARRIYHDFSYNASATELINKIQLQTIRERRTVSKATFMYKIMSDLVDITPQLREH